ncbi:MAG TPA: hypothetical protein VG146_02420 [Verrucomicrobiae bacterium]|nr:hypothetical protein [Verrucomicrobiae bacterium]
MTTSTKLPRWFGVPALTRKRIWFAYSVAIATDAVQLLFGAVPGADEVLDVIAMVLVSAAIGFHPLLLPTFVIELVPIVDMLPTWTGCTAVVIMLRKKAPTQPPEAPPIDISAKVCPVPPNEAPRSGSN